MMLLFRTQLVLGDGEQCRVRRLQQGAACESGACRQELEHWRGS